VLVPLNKQIGQIIECLLGSRGANFLSLHQTAQYLRDFDVEQLGSVHSFRRLKCARHQCIRSTRAQQDFEQC
jgi:hypothetical protein